MDEVARRAGISRQGLYLHFATKDALFKATIEHLHETSVGNARAALSVPDVPLEQSLFEAFESLVGDALVSQLDEVLESAERLTGRTAADLEGAIIVEFARALRETPHASPWRRHGDSPEAVATLLYATSAGLKRIASSVDEYLTLIRQAIRLVCTP